MTCVLDIHTESGVQKVPLTSAGRLAVYLDAGGSATIENSPAVPADQGGQLPIYSGDTGLLIGTIAFTCTGAPTKSSGSVGVVTGAGAAEAWIGGAGGAAGRIQ